MRPTMSIRGVRGSMFLPQLRLSSETLTQLWEVLPEWIPSVINPDVDARNGIYAAPNTWMLVSPEDKERLLFTPQKVDYLSISEAEYSREEIVRRMEKCKEIFLKILAISDASVSRLAFAPAYVFELDERDYQTFLNSMILNAQFKGGSIKEANFTRTFFAHEEINGENIWMNYLAKFETERFVQNVDGQNQLRTQYTLEFDINTRVENNVLFTNEAVADFIDKAPQFGEDYLNYFFSE